MKVDEIVEYGIRMGKIEDPHKRGIGEAFKKGVILVKKPGNNATIRAIYPGQFPQYQVPYTPTSLQMPLSAPYRVATPALPWLTRPLPGSAIAKTPDTK